jgi:transcriptional regulator with XRE-family HTH domain
MTIGARIRELRQERGLSQEALGARSGISTFSVSRIETGKSMPGSATVEKVAHALGVEPGELFQAAGAGKAQAPSKSGQQVEITEEPSESGEGKVYRVTAGETVDARDSIDIQLLDILHAVAIQEMTPEEALPRVRELVGAGR